MTANQPILRRATFDDTTELLALWQVAAENESRPVDTAAAVGALLTRDPDALIVAEVDGRIVGSVIAGWDGWRAHLYRLAVHPQARRRGIGRELVAAAHQRLAALGATRIDAMVLAANDLGQSLWRDLGYRVQDDWRRWVKPVSSA